MRHTVRIARILKFRYTIPEFILQEDRKACTRATKTQHKKEEIKDQTGRKMYRISKSMTVLKQGNLATPNLKSCAVNNKMGTYGCYC
jgi:hypothetical protein